MPIKNASLLLYVFDGMIQVNDFCLIKGESLIIENEHPIIWAKKDSDIVLFITDKHTPFFERGMYSGNKI